MLSDLPLAGAPLVAGRWLVALGAWVVFAAAGSWAPRLCSRRADLQSDAHSPAARLALATSAGLASALVLWTASLVAFESPWPGTVVLVLLAAAAGWSGRSLWRGFVGGEGTGVLLLLTGVALALATAHSGLHGVAAGDALHYFGRFGDTGAHAYWAQLVADHGLPLVHASGFSPGELAPLQHSGHLALLAGLETLTRRPVLDAVFALQAVGYACLAWNALALVGPFVRRRALLLLVGVAPLVWGSAGGLVDLALLEGPGLVDPYAASVASVAQPPSGTLYHNLTQVLALALGGAALLAVARAGDDLRAFGLAVALTVTSGWVKPSLAIFLGPALFSTLLLHRARPAHFGVLIGGAALGLLGYLLPSFVHALPPGTGWTVGVPGGAELLPLLAKLALACGVALPVAFASMGRRRRVGRTEAWVDVLWIAALGALVFALFFREAGMRAAHGNHLWGLLGTLVLLSPFLVLRVAGEERAGYRFLCIGLVAVHLAGGALYALSYPALARTSLPEEDVRVAHEIRAATTAGERILLDTELDDPYFPLHVRRRVSCRSTVQGDAEWTAYEAWRLFLDGRAEADAGLAGRHDAIVLGRGRPAAAARLRHMGWEHAGPVGANFGLWRPTAEGPR